MSRDNHKPSTTTIEIAIVDSIAKVPRDEWNALVSDNDSAFLDWDWLAAMEETKCAARTTGWHPHHMLARAPGESRILAACPVYLKTHSMGEFVFDHGWAEAAERAGIRYYPKLLVGIPFTPHTGRRFITAPELPREEMVAALGRALVKLCTDNKLSSAHVNFCEPDEARILARVGFLERSGYQYHWHNAGFSTFDDYLERLKHKRRIAVKHEQAALVEQHIRIEKFSGDAITSVMLSRAYDLYLSTIDKLYWGRRYLTREFFERLGENFKRYITLILAYRGSKLIAGTFNVEKAGVIAGRYWGCFEEHRFLHFNVCYYAGIEHAIARGLSRFEPGAGGEYKWLRGFDPALTSSMHYVTHQGLARAIGDFLKRERVEIEHWIREGAHRSQLKPPPPNDAEAR